VTLFLLAAVSWSNGMVVVVMAAVAAAGALGMVMIGTGEGL
jgi:hypothetical protein